MTELFDRISSWFLSLQEQERRILLYGAPLILFLVLYLILIQPLGSAYFSRQTEMTDHRDGLVWVRDQRTMLERLNTSCDANSQVFSEDNFRADIEAVARRFGIVPTIRVGRVASSFEMQISGSEGNRVLNLVRVLACSGAKVTSLELQRVGTESSELSATLLVSRAGAGN